MRAFWSSEYLLLGLLVEQPLHGYELSRLVRDDQALRAIWHLKRSEVYFLLGKLQSQGLIAEVTAGQQDCAATSRQSGGPPRQVYEVTAEGLAALDEWLEQPVSSPRQLRAAFLAKLYLAWRCNLASAPALLEEQLQVLRRWQERLSRSSGSDPFLVLANKLRLAQVEAASNALEEFQAILGSEA